MTTTTYRNDTTGYTVTLIDNGPTRTRVIDSKGYSFPMIDVDYPHAATLAASRAHLNGATLVPAPAPVQMASPLAADAQVRTVKPLRKEAILTMPTTAQARCLNWAANDPDSYDGKVGRGMPSASGSTVHASTLRAMALRGWLDLDHPIRPNYGKITDTGRHALAAYVAKYGEVL
jgi:hypothetical protein